MNLKTVLSQIEANCCNLHWVAPLLSSLRQLHYGALRRRRVQEPSTPSGLPSYRHRISLRGARAAAFFAALQKVYRGAVCDKGAVASTLRRKTKVRFVRSAVVGWASLNCFTWPSRSTAGRWFLTHRSLCGLTIVNSAPSVTHIWRYSSFRANSVSDFGEIFG